MAAELLGSVPPGFHRLRLPSGREQVRRRGSAKRSLWRGGAGGARRGKPSGLCTGSNICSVSSVSGFICSKPRWSGGNLTEQGLQQIPAAAEGVPVPSTAIQRTVQQVSFARPRRRPRRFCRAGPAPSGPGGSAAPSPPRSRIPPPSARPPASKARPAAAAAPARRLAPALVPRSGPPPGPAARLRRPGSAWPLPAIATCASVGRRSSFAAGRSAERLESAGANPGGGQALCAGRGGRTGEARAGRARCVRGGARRPEWGGAGAGFELPGCGARGFFQAWS